MKIDKLFTIGLGMIVGGVIWFLEFFEIILPSRSSKFYCEEFECVFLGIVFFIIGFSIMGYKVYRWKVDRDLTRLYPFDGDS